MADVKNAILRAKVNGVVQDIFVKSDVNNVMYDASTTLSEKLAAMILEIAGKASSGDLTTGLAGKAEKTHTHAQSEVTGLETALAARPTTEAMNTAISTAISELIDGAPETYDTLKEIATYIASHADVVTALNEAIGKKADKEAFEAVKRTVDALGTLASKDKVAESDLTDELKEKVNAAAEGNHSHSNKALLDTYTQTEANLADAVSKKHSHSNKSVLDGITADQVESWDTSLTDAQDYTDEKVDELNERITPLETAKHTHGNKSVLDGIDAGTVTKWNNKADLYLTQSDAQDATVMANMTERDLWIKIID